MLRVHQVALRLGITTQHVRDFIDEGALGAINLGKAGRKFWRVPVEAYQAFLKERSTSDKGRF
jgi:excisionase family DNA binding protein